MATFKHTECLGCGDKIRIGGASGLCRKCFNDMSKDDKLMFSCKMVVLPWEILPDGTRMRTVSNVG